MPASIICDRKLSLLSKPVTTKHPVPRHEEDLQSATTRFKKREQDRDKVVVRGRWYLEKGGEGQAVSPLYLVRGPHATKLGAGGEGQAESMRPGSLYSIIEYE
jgi:hypothetical protein